MCLLIQQVNSITSIKITNKSAAASKFALLQRYRSVFSWEDALEQTEL